MQANAQIAVLERIPPRVQAGSRFVPCERQVLQLGLARLERIRGVGTMESDDPGLCRLIFQLSAGSSLTLGGKPVEQVAGTWSAGANGSFEAETERGGELIALAFPLDCLSRSVAGQMQSRSIIALPTRGAAKACLEFSRSSFGQSETISLAVAEALGDSLVELAKLAIIEQCCTKRGETVRETVRTRIQSFIHRNLADPELTIDRIAERMQCTKRYLHKVFSDEGETLNQYIWAQRLEMCRAQLTRPDLAGKSITEIAFACGFSNAAHFSRSFRSRFGQAPRSYRRAMLEG